MLLFGTYLNLFWDLPIRFQSKATNETATGKLTFSVFLRFRPPLLPSPLHVSLYTILYSYNQVFMANHSPVGKHISTHFSG
ncbi:hypothetical protein GCWU000325_00724 [Alloprevotella tannerae ATCC 51259]|uniref:Uncharacterized protein n=1 Tax=Alloprevotella tannerae ATCC 51259 TaxID=626522 RepID=C9LEU3_9BACT|nr:hypothetical protein GCWU000325_00724 [Alloprevotella tannerae ATCC 51259]